MEQDMSEKSSTPDVPAEDVAAAQRAADAGAVTAELGGPVVVATPDVVTPAAVAPPVPSAAPAVHGSGGGWQAPPTATAPPGSRPSGLRPSWPLVIGAAVLAAVIATIGTGLIVGLAVHHRDQVSARDGRASTPRTNGWDRTTARYRTRCGSGCAVARTRRRRARCRATAQARSRATARSRAATSAPRSRTPPRA